MSSTLRPRMANDLETPAFKMNEPFEFNLETYSRVVVQVDYSKQLIQEVLELNGTVLKIDTEKCEVLVYLDGGTVDWFPFEKIFTDDNCKSPQEAINAVGCNQFVSEECRKSTQFFLKSLMRFHETGQAIPEMEMEINEVESFYGRREWWVCAMSTRPSLIYIISNNPIFNKIWVYSGSPIFAKIAEKYESAKIITDSDHVFFNTRPNLDYVIQSCQSDHKEPELFTKTCPRAFQYMFHARNYILSQFDEEQDLKDEPVLKLDRNEMGGHPRRNRENFGFNLESNAMSVESDSETEMEQDDRADISYSEHVRRSPETDRIPETEVTPEIPVPDFDTVDLTTEPQNLAEQLDQMEVKSPPAKKIRKSGGQQKITGFFTKKS